jgi:hypothetical protein
MKGLSKQVLENIQCLVQEEANFLHLLAFYPQMKNPWLQYRPKRSRMPQTSKKDSAVYYMDFAKGSL